MLFQAEKTEKARGLMSSLEKLNLAPFGCESCTFLSAFFGYF